MSRYREAKRRMFTTRDCRERLKLMYLVRGLAWKMEYERNEVGKCNQRSTVTTMI